MTRGHRSRGAATAVTALAMAAAAVGAATAPDTGVANGSACPARHTKTLLQSRVVRVYRFTSAAGRRKGRVESCVLATGHRTSLDAHGATMALPPPKLALSRYAVAWFESSYDELDVEQLTLSVADARSRDGLIAAADPHADDGLVARLVVRPNQALAWSVLVKGADRVYRWQSFEDEPKLLARGRRLDAQSLRLSGRRLSWRQGGRVRHALLR